MRNTQAALTGLIQHEHAPLALAQRASAVPPPAPLFSTLLNYRHTAQAGDLAAADAAELGLSYLAADERSNYPLTLDVDDHGSDFALTVVTVGSVPPEAVLDLLEQAITGLVDALEHTPDAPIERLDVLPPAERSRLLAAAGPAPVPPTEQLLHRLFEAQVRRDPDAIALVAGDARMSYGELNARANRLAHHLCSQGVGPDRLVGLCFQRSAEMVVGLLAVLKAGGAYLPLDPAYPARRLADMLADAAPVLVLTHPPARSVLAGVVRTIDLVADAPAWADQPVSDPLVAGLTPDRLAYLIYTSGTTGTANGVQVEHRQLAGIAAGWQQLLELGPGLTHLQLASLSFDVCTADVIRSLGFGGRLVLCPRELLADSAGLFAFIQQHQVNFADFVPAVLLPLLSQLESTGGDLACFETLICGSEAWTPAAADRLRALCGPSVRIINAYGLTEAAVDSTHYRLPIQRPADWDGLNHLPIGRPLPGVRAYLLDRLGEPVPDGVAGELHLGGVGVARGYLNRPELTAQRFLDSPFVAGDRLYRTGDLARRLPSGDLEFLGRRDHQVKLRGLRVELAEIEAVLAGCPGVREVVVTADGQRLSAYYLADPDRPPTVDQLRDWLAGRLPAHLVPAGYRRLDGWPLTPNGKLDRAALPAIDRAPGHQPPADPLETWLASIWRELLGVDQVGRQDHFFALGGHSLLAMRLVGLVRQQLGRELSPAAVFAAPTLAGFAERLRTVRPAELLPPIRPVDRSGPLEPSFAQQRLWFLAQLEGAGEAYHIPQAWQLDGPLDRAALGRALDALVARHEALRTRFVGTSSARQLIDPPDIGFCLRVEDLTGRPEALAQVQQDEAAGPFDLSTGPLARGRLLVLAPERHVLLLTLHHIVSDGWSVGVLIRELTALYGAFSSGSDDPLPPLPVQYADYAAWQRAWFADRVLERQAEYWQRALADPPALLTLPTDRPRPVEPDYRGGQLQVEFDTELTAGLRQLSARHGCTVYLTVLVAWALVLSRLSGQDDVVIGTPTANRRRHELAGLIGFFVNTLAIRLDLSGAPTGAELLRRARSVLLGALENQDLPFEQLVELVNPARSLAHSPLFQAMLTWQDDEDAELALPGLRTRQLGAPYPVAKFDLTLALADLGDRISGSLDYASALFDRATAERYLGHLYRVLGQLVADADRPATGLALTEPAERDRLLALGDGREPTGRRPRRIQQLFQARAIATPDAIAVRFQGQSLTYRELNGQANRLAHRLRAAGAGPDRLVAICAHRSPELVVGLLAILKSGAGYLPLDPAYPADRLAFMLADSEPVLLLCHPPTRAALAEVTGPMLDLIADAPHWSADSSTDPEPAGWHPDQLAYLIYTSGSTGRPKGVAQTWRCADNLIDWMLHDAAPDSRPPERVLQFASPSFDVSFQEIWSTLCAGATLVLMAEEQRADLAQLPRFLLEQRIERAFLPAAVLHHLASLGAAVEPVGAATSCEIVTAGEALRVTDELRALVDRLGGDRLYNHYGPTETHAATHHTLLRAQAADWPELPPIGRPVTGTRVYLVDQELQPVPVGVVGELYVGGDCVARGYLNRPGLTASRFVPDPFAEPGDRMYRTGDLARWRPDGTLDYLGRSDDQVKVRGFRVELGEVEAVLAQLPALRQVGGAGGRRGFRAAAGRLPGAGRSRRAGRPDRAGSDPCPGPVTRAHGAHRLGGAGSVAFDRKRET